MSRTKVAFFRLRRHSSNEFNGEHAIITSRFRSNQPSNQSKFTRIGWPQGDQPVEHQHGSRPRINLWIHWNEKALDLRLLLVIRTRLFSFVNRAVRQFPYPDSPVC
jgi:hypothetical protein